MTPNDFGKHIKNCSGGTFLFYGDEQYLKQYYINLAKKNILQNGDGADTLSGESTPFAELCRNMLDISSMPSMSSDKRFIVVSEVDWCGVSEDDLCFLEDCLNEIKEYDGVIVILDTRPDNFNAGTEKKPSDLFKRLSKSLTPVCFAKESPARLAVWIQKHFAANKINVSPDICSLMVKYCGRDMTSLNNEIDKLSAYVHQNGKNTVTEQDLKEVCSFTNEIDTFDFSNAIIDGNADRALSILNDMKLHKERPELILGSIISVYSDLFTVKTLLEAGFMNAEIAQKTKMHEYRVKIYAKKAARLSKNGLTKAISLCHEADMKVKASPLDKYSVIETLLLKLFMTGRLS